MSPRGPADFLPARGPARGLTLAFEVVRELRAEDLFELAVGGGERSAPPSIQRIRTAHHHAARLLAQGKSASEVAIAVGRTPQRIRDLQKDPTFSDLVAFYTDQFIEAGLEDAERARVVATEVHEIAMGEIRERLEDPASLARVPIAELRQIAQMTGDRTILPPKSAAPGQTVPTQITFNIAGRGLNVPDSEIVDVTPTPALNSPTSPPDAEEHVDVRQSKNQDRN